MDADTLWETGDWTYQARQLVDGIKKFPDDSKIIVIIRHSHRNKPTLLEKTHKLRLTSQGHEMALKLGENLPTDRPIRLFHSVIWRCEETAQDILKGFEKVGGKGTLEGAFPVLYKVTPSTQFFVDVFKKYNEYQFIFRWVGGLYPSDQIIHFQTYCQNAGKAIWSKLDSAQERGIDIHVTHDLFLVALKFGWLGIPPTKDWVPFLSNFALSLTNKHLNVFNDNKFFKAEFPYWWNR